MPDNVEFSFPTPPDEKKATRELKSEQDRLAFGKPTADLEWDGIRKLDYPPPRWWVLTFIGCVLFAALWWLLYPSWPTPFGTWRGILGYDQRAVIEDDLARAQAARADLVTAIASGSLETIRADRRLTDYALFGGEVAFNNNCAPCHGLGGAGQGVFPTLADDDWIWGGTPEAIEYTIRYGIRNGGDETRDSIMPAFGADEILTRDQIADVAAYLLSLSGQSEDAAAAERGASVYAENCVACHGEDGGGLEEIGGPRLNDAIWLYGGSREAVISQISRPHLGVMPGFGTRLDEATIKMLVLYVHSLGGGR